MLRRLFDDLRSASWILATVIGAVVAWMLGMIPSTIASLTPTLPDAPPPPELGAGLELALAAAMGVAGGLVLSVFQWRVLRRHTLRSAWWLAANAAAWAVGMPWIFWLVGATIAEGLTPISAILFLLGLAVAGALVGAVHGLILVRVLRPTSKV